MNFEIIAGLAVLATAIWILWARTFNGELPRPPEHYSTKQDDEDFSKLLTKTLGDRSKANRLIAYERQRNPNASIAELTKSAIERLEWDNGR